MHFSAIYVTFGLQETLCQGAYVYKRLQSPFARDRQPERERGLGGSALRSGSGLDPHVAVQFARDMVGLEKAHAAAFDAFGRSAAPEAVEDVGDLACGDEAAAVGDDEVHAVGCFLDQEGDAGAVTVFDGVFNDILQYLGKSVRVAVYQAVSVVFQC